MSRFHSVACVAAIILAACGGGGGGGGGSPTPTPQPGPAHVKIDMNRLAGPTHDVEGMDLDVAKIALKFHPANPNPHIPAPIGPVFDCEDDAEMFDAESQVRLDFGNTDARVRIGDHEGG